MSDQFLLRSKSFNDNVENMNQTKNHFTSKIIDLFESYIYSLSDNEKENGQTLIKNINKFIERLKTDYTDLFQHVNKDKLKVRRDINYDSLLSMVDIKIDLDDNYLLKELKGLNLNENQYPDFLITNDKEFDKGPIMHLKHSGTNTDYLRQCDISIQTLRSKTDYKSNHDMYYLRAQIDQTQVLINMFMIKKESLIKVINYAYEKLQNLILFYNPCTDSKLKSYIDIEVETCGNWSQQCDLFNERLSRLSAITKELKDITLINKDLEKTCNSQIQEIHTIFETVEDMSCKYAELIQSIDNLNSELLDMREINEFQESENQSLTITQDKLYEEFDAYVKDQKKRLKEIRSSFDDVRQKWLMEKRVYNYKSQEIRNDFIMAKTELDCNNLQLKKVGDSVRNYPLYGGKDDNKIIELKKQLTMLEDSKMAGIQDKNRGEEEESFLSSLNVDDSYYLKKNVVTLTNECDTLENDLACAMKQESIFKKCFNELKSATSGFGSPTRTSNEIDICREILSKNDV